MRFPKPGGSLRPAAKRATAVAVAALTVTGVAVATAGSASARFTDLSTLQVYAKGPVFQVAGPRNIQAGLVKVTLQGEGAEHSVNIVSFSGGWNFAKYRAARQAIDSGAPNGLRQLNAAIKHTTFYGGVDSAPGRVVSETVQLTPGAYTLYSDSGQAPSHPYRFTVFGTSIYRSHPTATGRVVATTANRFAGSAVLPAHGTLRFANRSDYTPHFLFMQRVAEGTTRAQVLKAFTGQGRPSFVRPGFVGTSALSPGQSQTLTYRVPAGEYAQLCFFPDPKTGMPHAMMGMIRMVHLK